MTKVTRDKGGRGSGSGGTGRKMLVAVIVGAMITEMEEEIRNGETLAYACVCHCSAERGHR